MVLSPCICRDGVFRLASRAWLVLLSISISICLRASALLLLTVWIHWPKICAAGASFNRDQLHQHMMQACAWDCSMARDYRDGSWIDRSFFTRLTDPHRPFGHRSQSSSHMRTGGMRKLACKFRAKRLTAYMFIYLSSMARVKVLMAKMPAATCLECIACASSASSASGRNFSHQS